LILNGLGFIFAMDRMPFQRISATATTDRRMAGGVRLKDELTHAPHISAM
jgi:hypothetical protein